MLISIPLWEFELHNHITTTRAPDQPHIARPRQTAILPTILISAVVASALFCSEPDMTKYMLLVVYSFPRLNCQKELVKFRYFRLKSIANSFPPQGTNSFHHLATVLQLQFIYKLSLGRLLTSFYGSGSPSLNLTTFHHHFTNAMHAQQVE